MNNWSARTVDPTADPPGPPPVDVAPPSRSPADSAVETGQLRSMPRRLGKARPHLAAAASYLLLAIILTGGVWSEPARNIIAGNPHDTDLYTWWLAHTAHAVSTGSNPFITHLANAPEGINAMWNTSVFLPGLLLTPITLTAGPVVSYNIIFVLAFPLSAFGAYLLARKLAVRSGAAYVAGLVYGFSPALVAAGLGHLSMVLAPALPLLLLLVVEIFQGPHRPFRNGILLGGGAACQLLTGEEALFITAVTAIVGLAVLALSCAGHIRHVTGAGHSIGIAFLTCVAISAAPLGIQFFGTPRSHGSPFLANYFKSDLTGLYVPSGQQLLASESQAARAAAFRGGPPEYMNYLGWPMIITCIWATAVGFRDLKIRVIGLTGTVLAVLALGSTLLVNGVETGLRLPWSLVGEVPIFDSALPNRFSLGTALMAGLIVAITVDRLRGKLGRGSTLPTVALAAGCLLPIVPRPYPAERSPDIPSFFSTQAVEVLPEGASALLLPYPTAVQTAPMAWQAAAGFHFSMPGGFFIGPGPDGKAYMGGPGPSATAQLLIKIENGGFTGTVTPGDVAQARNDLARLGVRSVVLGPANHADELRDTVSRLTGSQPRFIEGVYVWLLP